MLASCAEHACLFWNVGGPREGVPDLLSTSKRACRAQVVTGSWSKKAAEEAGKYARVNVAAKGDNASIPPLSAWKLTPGARYVHYCDNETIQVSVMVHTCPTAGRDSTILHGARDATMKVIL